MRAPVRRCSSPSSWMISVPDAAQLPSTPRPVFSRNGARISSGKPSGKVRKGVSSRSPASSQWPVAVSLPADSSVSLPNAPRACFAGATPSSGRMLPSPSSARVGQSAPPAARAMWPRVLDPASP